MFGLDEAIAALGDGGLLLALAVALLLGLRHATDPDHLTAICTLVLSDADGPRRAAGLGLSWGAGHALALFALGLPIVAFGDALPGALQLGAEVLVGLLIILLAVRLLVRRRRGTLHLHPHSHGDLVHAHPHVHEHADAGAHPGSHQVAPHGHPHAERLGRTPRMAFGIGLVHGIGGSAGVGILVAAGATGAAAATAALLVFAAGTAVSMGLASAAFAHGVTRRPVQKRMEGLVPALGTASLLFGGWYVLAALDLAAYPF